MGQSLACKKCNNHFTLAPVDDLPASALAGGEEHRRGTVTSPPTPALPISTANHKETLEPTVTAGEPKAEPIQVTASLPSESLPVAPIPWNRYAVAALLLASLALGCAAVSWLQWLTIPLAGAGMLAAIICLVGTPIESPRDAVVLAIGGLVAAPTLFIALFWPALFGMDTRVSPESPPPPDPNRQTIQPRRDRVGNSAVITPEALDASTWADANRYDVDHGNVRLRIVEVTLRDVPAARRKDRRPERELVITVMMSHVGTKGPVTFRGWTESTPPLLRDPTGGALVFKGRAGEATSTGRPLVPFQPVRESLLFSAPEGTIDYLRLELPAAAFGGSGTVRFQVPGNMVAR
jgi:hypothetical protein